MGFPGNAKISATYRLWGNKLRLDFEASLDQVSPASPCAASLFQLGEGEM